LIAFTLGIPQNRNIDEVRSKAVHVEVPEFKPRAIKIELPG